MTDRERALIILGEVCERTEYLEDGFNLTSFEAIKAMLEFRESELSRLKDEGEPESNELHPCPYSIAVRCTMVDPCLGCETWAKYKAGEEISRLKNEGEDKKYKGYWWCMNCKREVSSSDVTFDEAHNDCGHPVMWKDNSLEQGEDNFNKDDRINKIIIERIKVDPLYRNQLMQLLCNKPAEQSDKLTAEIPADIVTKMQKEFEPNPDTSFKQGMYSGYAFGLQDGYKFVHSQFVGEKVTDEMIDKYYPTVETGAYNSMNFARQEGAKALRDGKIK